MITLLKDRTAIFIAVVLFILIATPALADDGEGVDYGYWCTTCGRQHAPGESCPASDSSGTSSRDDSYNQSPPANSPTTTTTLDQAEKHKQEAAELNRQGEELMIFGRYEEAYNKFWHASFMESDVSLYRNNLEHAKAVLNVRREERDTKIKEASVRLKKLVSSDPSVVDTRNKKAADETVVALLFLTDTRPGGLFKLNPELPFINPLREPERYKAWEAEERKRLQLEEWKTKSKELDAARDRIIRAEGQLINRSQKPLFKSAVRQFQIVRGNDPITTYASLESRRVDDPNLGKKLDAIAKEYWQKSDAANLKAREQALAAMKAEVERFYQRHPKLKQ